MGSPAHDVVTPQPRRAPTATSAGDLAAPLARVETRLAQVLDEVADTWRIHTDTAVDGLGLLRDAVLSDGKRVRPMLCHWGYVAAHGDLGDADALSDVATAGAALELLHTFALVHDDVMDDSDTRRGRATIHRLALDHHVATGSRGEPRRHGEAVAVLLGDLAHACADNLVAELPADARCVWRDLTVQLMLGQYLDLQGTATARHDLATARLVARLKSGDYTVERPLQLGAVLAGTFGEYGDSLRSYGRPLGEAFQLRDDLLGVWGDPAVTGKPAGDDLRAGKPTVILALAHERTPTTPARCRLLRRIGAPDLDDAEVGQLQTLLEESGVRDAAERRVQRHVEVALRALDAGRLHPDGVGALERLATMLAWRER